MAVPARPADGRPGGVAAIIAGVGLLGVVGLEARRTSQGFQDADNPRVMLRYFEEHADLYTISGLLQILTGAMLVVTALALWRLTSVARPRLINSVGAAFGLLSAAFFFAQGVLRVQSPGTILHIAGLDEQAGLASYAAVQMAGTQGFGSSGGFALAIWAICVGIASWREPTLPRLLAGFAVLPTAFLLIGLLGSLYEAAQSLYLLYFASAALGLPVWCIGLGVVLLRLKSSTRGSTNGQPGDET